MLCRGLPELKTVEGHTSVRDFLAAVRGYHQTLNDNGKVALINFVLETKILGEARTKIEEATGMTSITDLTTLLNTKCRGPKSQATLQKKLNEATQGENTVHGIFRSQN
jgi:hypothetical protein